MKRAGLCKRTRPDFGIDGRGHTGRAMMRQALETMSVRTRDRGFYEITREVQSRVRQTAVQTGLCTLHLQHTSASLLIQENADPDVRRDFERFFARLVPDGDPLFVHTMEGDDDMPAHVRTALTAVNLSIPIAEGRLCLGTWQGIYVWEHRTAPHTRTVVVHVLGEGRDQP
jgi:secondary thiamine-phosphate synthase enzyme